jgi:hypothetical protein
MTEHDFEHSLVVSDEERSQSLQELEGQDWGDGNFPSHLVRTCHALRRKPLRDFTVEDLRIMIGQNFSLNYLVPLAIEQLQRDPLVAGDFFPGDLLAKVLKVEVSFWHMRPDLRQTIEDIVDRLKPFPEDLIQEFQIFQKNS